MHTYRQLREAEKYLQEYAENKRRAEEHHAAQHSRRIHKLLQFDASGPGTEDWAPQTTAAVTTTDDDERVTNIQSALVRKLVKFEDNLTLTQPLLQQLAQAKHLLLQRVAQVAPTSDVLLM